MAIQSNVRISYQIEIYYKRTFTFLLHFKILLCSFLDDMYVCLLERVATLRPLRNKFTLYTVYDRLYAVHYIRRPLYLGTLYRGFTVFYFLKFVL